MTITTGPNLNRMANGELGDVHTSEFNALLRSLDGLVMAHAVSVTTSAQPGSIVDGALYYVPPGATGASWAGNTSRMARGSTVLAAWEYTTPKEGWKIYAMDTDFEHLFDGSTLLFLRGAGASGSRPSSNIVTGAMFFNTTTGIPNFWTGSGWVTAAGAGA